MKIKNLYRPDFLEEDLFSKLRNISIAEVKTLIYFVEDLMVHEPRLIRLPCRDTIIVGDTHGDIKVCLAIVKEFFKAGYDRQVVYLGDYVDRGPHQVDNINLILLLKLNYPDRIFILRGNHETAKINQENGFLDKLTIQFGKNDGKILWFMYNRLFKNFPLAALSWNDILLVHGGVPEGLDDINKIDDLPREFNPQNQEVIELLWNDPNEKKRLENFDKNSRGGSTKQFGNASFQKFLEKNNLSMIIRAHEEIYKGFKYYFDKKLLSIFSARKNLNSPFERQIKPKFALLEKNGMIKILSIIPTR
ncbi:MAG: metallophosphoesterase [Promethearchaeota archaeon]